MPLVTRFRQTKKGPGYITRGADYLSFVLGFATEFSVHFVGDLYLAEVLLVVLLPVFLVLRGKRALRPELKIVYSLMGLWLIGLVVSDVYNHTDIVDRMRGSALIIFFALNILGMSMIFGHNDKRKVLYLVGLMVGSLAAIKIQPSPAFEDYPWKFGYAYGAIQLVMLLSSYFYNHRRYIISVSLIIGICAVNLLLNFRSPVLGLLLTIVLVFPIIPDRVIGMRIVPQSQLVRLAMLAVLALVAAEGAEALVSFVTRAGYVNQEAQAKNESQAKMGFLGGRPEFVIGLQAAFDAPIVGHGSWARDAKYYEMLYDQMVETEAMHAQAGGDILSEDGNPLIPGHSQIVTAWVWAGIAGLIFWSYMVVFFFKAMMRIALLRPPMAPAYMSFLIAMWWDIFFSPFAANRRIIESFMIVFAADLSKNKFIIVQDSWRRLGAVVTAGRLQRRISGSSAPSR